MRTILVTGAAGFIGSHVVDALLAQGDVVVAVDNFNNAYSPRFKEQNLSSHTADNNFFLYKVDIADYAALNAVFEKHPHIEAIIHLAGRAGVRASFEMPEEYRHSNVAGTEALFHVAAAHGTLPVVYASSSTVYGDEKVLPFKESTPFAGAALSPYGETKRETEHIAQMYAGKGVRSIGLRFFSIYGERCRPDLAPYIFTSALFYDKEITVLGDGTARRDFTYVSDAVKAVLSAVEMVRTVQVEVVNVGNGNPLPVAELISTLEELTGKTARVAHKEKHPGDADINCADLTKARALLNYQPTVKLHEGLARFVEWFKKEQR